MSQRQYNSNAERQAAYRARKVGGSVTAKAKTHAVSNRVRQGTAITYCGKRSDDPAVMVSPDAIEPTCKVCANHPSYNKIVFVARYKEKQRNRALENSQRFDEQYPQPTVAEQTVTQPNPALSMKDIEQLAHKAATYETEIARYREAEDTADWYPWLEKALCNCERELAAAKKAIVGALLKKGTNA